MLGVYRGSNDAPAMDKDLFFNKLNNEITAVGRTRELMILGDLNSRTGRSRNSKSIGPYGESDRNDNGERLIELCEQNGLRIANGFFEHKDIHKYTWIQPTRNLKSIIDYGIFRETGGIDVRDIRVHRRTAQISDHYLSKVKARFSFPKNNSTASTQNQRTNITAENESHNLESLTTSVYKTIVSEETR